MREKQKTIQRSKPKGLLGFASLIWILAAAGAVAPAAAVRRLPEDPSRSIASRLKADDDVVIVARDLSDRLISSRSLTKKDVIDDAAVVADYVVIVDVDVVRGVLTHNDSWIETRLSGKVREVIRVSPGHELSAGQRIEASVGPGELTIGHVLVMTTDDPEDETHFTRLLPARRSYLLFLAAGDSGEVPLAVHEPLLIEGDRLRYPWPPRTMWFEPPSAMDGMPLAEVARMVRQAKTSWRFEANPKKP